MISIRLFSSSPSLTVSRKGDRVHLDVVVLEGSWQLFLQPLPHLVFVVRHPLDIGCDLFYGLLQGDGGRAEAHLRVVFFESLQLWTRKRQTKDVNVCKRSCAAISVSLLPLVTQTQWRTFWWLRWWDQRKKMILFRTWNIKRHVNMKMLRRPLHSTPAVTPVFQQKYKS